MELLFLNYILSLGWVTYAIIFVCMFLEGDVVLFSAVYLASQGHLNIWLLIPISIIGVGIGDICWYKIGEHLERRSKFFRKIAAKITKPIDERLQKRPLSTVFITKFTFGIHHATLLRAGATKIPFKKYCMAVFMAGIIWIGVIGGLAYFSSISIDLIKKYIKYGEVGLLIGIIIFFTITHFLSKIGNKKIKKEQ